MGSVMSPRGPRGRSIVIASLASLLLVPGVTLSPATAAEPRSIAADCPAAVPLGTVQPGMVGDGWTVVKGSAPQPFRVEVLGLLPGGIGAGRDLIVVKVSDLPDENVIAHAGGGVWAGISGSPVYVNGRLLGAIAYSFAGASPIAGVTPAEYMYDVLSLGANPVSAEALAPREVRLSKAARRSIAARAGRALPEGNLRRLSLPFTVSGLSAKRVDSLRSHTTAAGLTTLVVSGSRAVAAGTTAELTRPRPGGNLVAALSYGDLTLAGIGTATAVCGDQVLGFGHQMELTGPSSFGASDADALAILSDPVFGSYKLARITTPVGTVDQDRLAAIRADLRTTPAAATVTTTIENLDTGRTRTGVTTVMDQAALPGIAAFASLANLDATFDEIGDGRANSRWTITGVRAGTIPFSITRFNRWSSREDVSVEPAFDVATVLDALAPTDDEDVRIDTVTLTSQISTRYQQLRLADVAVSVNGGRYTRADHLTVPRGATLTVRAGLKRFRSSTLETRTFTIKVPSAARGRQGVLSVVGGLDLVNAEGDEEDGCLFSPDACDAEDGNLDTVLRSVLAAPHNNDLTATLSFFDPETEAVVLHSTKTRRQHFTVRGSTEVMVRVRS